MVVDCHPYSCTRVVQLSLSSLAGWLAPVALSLGEYGFSPYGVMEAEGVGGFRVCPILDIAILKEYIFLYLAMYNRKVSHF